MRADHYDCEDLVEAIHARSMDPKGAKRQLWDHFFFPLLEGRLSRGRGRGLDFGAGTGWLPFHAACAGLSVDAYDPSARMCAMAEQLAKTPGRRRFEVIRTLGEPQRGAFTLVVANWVMPAIRTRVRLRNCFVEARQLLAPGGRLVLTLNHPAFIDRRHRFYEAVVDGLPKAGDLHETRLFDSRGREAAITRDTYWPTAVLTESARGAGLAIVEERSLYEVMEGPGAQTQPKVPAYQVLEFEP